MAILTNSDKVDTFPSVYFPQNTFPTKKIYFLQNICIKFVSHLSQKFRHNFQNFNNFFAPFLLILNRWRCGVTWRGKRQKNVFDPRKILPQLNSNPKSQLNKTIAISKLAKPLRVAN